MPKREFIQKMFDSIAKDYDKLNHIMSFDIDKIWRKRAIKHLLQKRAGKKDDDKEIKILDLACGTGDFSIQLARSLREKDLVYGLDLSSEMLKIMEEKIKKENLERHISIHPGSAENLPFEDESFDFVTIAFGIRNFEDREQALKEILRVLRHEGRLLILELSQPINPVVKWFYNIYFTKITPIIGGSISGNKRAYKYLPLSVLNFPLPKKWIKTMCDCGFNKIEHRAFSFGICRMYIGEK